MLSKRDQANSVKNLEQIRKTQEKETEVIMKQEHINSLINNERAKLTQSKLGI